MKKNEVATESLPEYSPGTFGTQGRNSQNSQSSQPWQTLHRLKACEPIIRMSIEL